MIRRLLRDRDNRVAAYVVAGLLTALIFGYGERQQTDAKSPPYPTCEGCGKTAVAAKE
ncbi:hypothetical protein R2537_007077 [Pseudomonas aeruginosa]|nr:hypothetical protein [Pseudomonas aeruginosa]